MSRLRLRLRVLFDRRHDQALREELEFHVEQLAAQQRRAGLGHDEALAAARRQFGNLTRIQEQSHDLFAFRHVEDLLKDLRYGARLLVKHPGFSLIAMLSIAIGVGANAAMFSFADGQVLRPLRVTRPAEVVAVSAVAPRVTEGFLSDRLSYPDYRDVRERRRVVPEGYELPEGMESVTVFAARIDEGYLDAMEIPVVSGRGILETDTDESPRVVLVNQTLAARYWPEQDPVGKRLRFVGRETESWVEVVGVTADSRYNWIGEAPTPFLYVSQMQAAAVRAAAGITQGRRSTLVVATDADPAALASPLRAVVQELDVNMPISGMRTIEEFYHGNAVGLVNGLVSMVGGMGLLGVALALVSLHGLVAYAVARRTREIGIRMAVGARRISILAMVLRHGMVPVAWGIALGGAGSLAVGGLVVGVFPNAAGADPVTYLLAVPGLATLTLLSACVPAHGATRIDPLLALRQE